MKMSKKVFKELLKEDFFKARGALSEIIDHNRIIDSQLLQDLTQGDFKKLEEHIEISKMIIEGVKAFNELYKQNLENIKRLETLPESSSEKESPESSKLLEIMKSLEED